MFSDGSSRIAGIGNGKKQFAVEKRSLTIKLAVQRPFSTGKTGIYFLPHLLKSFP